jgi:hypothetical protein
MRTTLLHWVQHHPVELMTWTLPAAVVPSLRWFQDKPELRNQLFIRDFVTFSLGSVHYFGAQLLTQFALKNVVPKQRLKPFSAATGLAAYMAFAGVGALRISKWLEKRLLPPQPAKVTPHTLQPVAPFSGFRREFIA